MKVVMVTPCYHQQRGNTVTVQRICRYLARFGVSAEVLSLTEEEPFPVLPQGEIVHGFNAYCFYRYWQQQGPWNQPYIVTITGTDLNQQLFDPSTRDMVIKSFINAKAIHIFNPEAYNLLGNEVPWAKEKTCIIPQGIIDFPVSEERILEKEAGTFVFLLPAGIRKVKNIPAAISMLAPLYNEDPKIRLLLVGPVLEEAEGDKIHRLIKDNNHWIQYLGQVQHQEMGEIYRLADVVLNSSLSEGQSQALLEAMAAGIPVLAADVIGNRDIVEHGQNGFLYRNKNDFLHYASLLKEDEGLRHKLGKKGQAYVRVNHAPEKEAKDLLALYQSILSQK
jgi:glycosyltransferase involved in cell wall biosynthesis